jgi:ribosomal protein S18 acetylase RimI-like enzyme
MASGKIVPIADARLLLYTTIMNVRKVKVAEAGLVHDILLENGRWMHSNGIEQWPTEWLESIAGDIAKSVGDEKFWCCTIKNEIAAVAEVKTDPEALWGFDAQSSAYVHKLAIRRKFASEGVGAALLRSTIENAFSDGLSFVRLDCVASNRRLRNYYEDLGFRYISTENNGEVDLALYQLEVGHSK